MDKTSTQDQRYFRFVSLEDNPDYLRQSYALRYEVYCEETGFLNPLDYPDGLETDEFDPFSLHIGAVNQHDKIIGTARLVRPSVHGLPMESHCREFYDDFYRDHGVQDPYVVLHGAGMAEISRLAVSSRYRRRANDGRYALSADAQRRPPQGTVENDRRTSRPVIALGLYKALYQASKRNGISHWLAAMEMPLTRHLRRYQLMFKQIGPEVDYYGPVRPYLLSVADTERRMSRRLPDLMEDWLDGLESEYTAWYGRPEPD